jgi:hypothetical protein
MNTGERGEGVNSKNEIKENKEWVSDENEGNDYSDLLNLPCVSQSVRGKYHLILPKSP